MISFIPVEYYGNVVSGVLITFIFPLCLLLLRHPKAVVEHAGVQNRVVLVWGYSCLLTLILLIGFRPIGYAFGDMGNYYRHFLEYKDGAPLRDGDPVFEALLWTFANYFTAPLFFFLCAVLYLVPLMMAGQRVLGTYWPLAFIFAASQYDFYGYAVNGLRQGIASSLFLLALTFSGPAAWATIGLSIGFHGSFFLPAIAYAITSWMTGPKIYLWGWTAALLGTSLYAGFGDILASTGILGDKFDAYVNLDDVAQSNFSAVGYRLDFIFYSMLPIAVGVYFLVVRGFVDKFYLRLFNVYLTCNAAWLLVIRIPASNRFAYLSWGLMGLVIAYPFIRFNAFRGQHVVFVILLLSFYSFTFFGHI